MNTLKQFGLVAFFTQQLPDFALLEERLGRVIAVQRSKSTVVCATGERVVELSPLLRQASALERPTVGDWVILDEALTRIDTVLERKTLFKRIGAGSSTDIQPIAANIDTLFVVTSCNAEFKESRLERYLALCAEASSGVGKSSLLNTLAGQSIAVTSAIRDDDKKGRHTTTHRELHQLQSGGLIIDVPGMRELKVADIDDSIGAVFEDIEKFAIHCRLSDCQHETEPGCAIRQAIESERLDSRRLTSYKKLLRENAQATASLAEKNAQGRQLAKMIKEVKSLKQERGYKVDPIVKTI